MKKNTKIAIIGAGPAGIMCAITAKRNNPNANIIIFEKEEIGLTLLPTGGGRCNLSYNETEIKTFAENYPRGEKFLYSIFTQFFVLETVKFFETIGIETYTQKDKRIFPQTNKSSDVVCALRNEIDKLKIKTCKEEIKNIKKSDMKFKIKDNNYDIVVIATGGKRNNLYEDIKNFGHTIIEQRPALCGLEIAEKYFSQISGVSLKKINAQVIFGKKNINLKEDLLFTHKGISGPLAYKISSIFATENYNKSNPIKLSLNFISNEKFNLQKLLEENPHKNILSILSTFLPKSLAKILLEKEFISFDKKCHEINKKERNLIENMLKAFNLTITNSLKEGEIVSAGGINLKEINPKTMESKLVKGLYFCGEILDIDGFCGGFNLQNCWSTGYIAGKTISEIY